MTPTVRGANGGCTRRALLLSAVVTLAACGSEASPPSATASAMEEAFPGTPEGLPANAPARFAFGAEASPSRVALWDIDVKADGEGLPAGTGTVAQGRQVFLTYCAACHGPSGIEGPNDRLVGTEPWTDGPPRSRTVGNYWPYATTLFDYIRRAMPQLTPGVLTADQTYAVIAYLLFLNEIVPEGAVMDASTLPQVEMPARDRFVVDDRLGGTGPIR